MNCKVCGVEFEDINNRQKLADLGIPLYCVACWKSKLPPSNPK